MNTLRDHQGQVITIDEDHEVALRFLKHGCPDGEYLIEAPGINIDFYRIDGMVYPSGGDDRRPTDAASIGGRVLGDLRERLTAVLRRIDERYSDSPEVRQAVWRTWEDWLETDECRRAHEEGL